MPKLTDTYSIAYACCDEVLFETGKFPTIEAVKARIGVNSPNTINHAIKAWTKDFAEKQLEKQNRPDLPACLLEAIEQVWKQATNEANKIYLDKEKEFKITTTELQKQLNNQQQNLNQKDQHIAELALNHQKLTSTLQSLEIFIAELEQRNKTQIDQIKSLENQVAAKTKQLAEQEQQWLTRQEQDQLWFARRLHEEKTFLEQAWQDKHLRQQETIQSLQLSEESLRQTCLSLSLEHKKATEELKNLQKSLDKKHKPGRNPRFPKRL